MCKQLALFRFRRQTKSVARHTFQPKVDSWGRPSASYYRKGLFIMVTVRRHSAAVLVSVCVVFSVCIVLLSDGVNGQLSSDWVSELGSSGDRSFELGIVDSSGTEMCDDGSWGECGATVDEKNENEAGHGRLLRRIRYYISYAALSANRVPCPPRSGRSYYTRNCYKATGPVRPYHRPCTAITRCLRDTS